MKKRKGKIYDFLKKRGRGKTEGVRGISGAGEEVRGEVVL